MDRESPQQVLLESFVDNLGSFLRRWEDGETFDLTSDGRVIARLGSRAGPRTWVPAKTLERILSETPLDQTFQRDVDDTLGATTDEWFEGRGKRLFGPFEAEAPTISG